MRALGLALLAGYGAHRVYSALALKWTGAGPGPRRARDPRAGRSPEQWLAQAGLADVRVSEFASAVGVVVLLGALVGLALFGAPVPALATGALAGTLPVAGYRTRRTQVRRTAMDAWPRLIEEIRILTGSLGRSVPNALLEVGLRGPDDLRPAFVAAHREWVLTTDFPRTVAVLKARLADPAADAACETLLVAHEIGGTDLDRRLVALADDRILDVQGRKDARSRQAGVRFARLFVLLVPLGMAVAGMSIGPGRQAYQTATGQAGVVLALGLTVLCWLWAGRLLVIPEPERVFDR